jgi:hypothetical protein
VSQPIRKGYTPKGVDLSPDDDEHNEQIALNELAWLPTAKWPRSRIWPIIDIAHHSTRLRLLSRALHLCHERGEPVPKELVIRLDRTLKVSDAPRARVHDQTLMQSTARLLVLNYSYSDAVKKLGVSGKSRLHNFNKRSAFHFHLQHELLLLRNRLLSLSIRLIKRRPKRKTP